MSILIGFLTFILVLNSLFLILLVLMQLPKKEAGLGTAFGGGATDALFGAGTGNVLTKATKYAAGLFLGLSLILSVALSHRVGEGRSRIGEELKKRPAAEAPAAPQIPVAPITTPQEAAPATAPAATEGQPK